MNTQLALRLARTRQAELQAAPPGAAGLALLRTLGGPAGGATAVAVALAMVPFVVPC